MAYFGPTLKGEFKLLTLVVNFAFQEGWITENEQQQITTMTTLNRRKTALLEILTNTKCDEGAERLLLALRSIEEKTMDLTPYSNTVVEYYYLSIIMSKLFSRGLVTEERKLVYENRLKSQLEKEKLKNSEKQKNGPVKCKIQRKKNNGYPTENKTNPMLIHLVINCVLRYLNLDEVKNARCISKVWSSVGLNVLKTRSRIVFSPATDGDFSDHDRTPTNFFSVFPIETQETVPFTKFSFRDGDGSNPWLVEKIDYFFRNQKKYIKELEFDRLDLIKEHWLPVRDHDYSLWLMDSAMTKPNTKYNTVLEIYGRPDWARDSDESLPVVQLSALANIKELRLSDIEIELNEGIVIIPTKIQISNAYFLKNKSNLFEICVNEFFDFSKSKEIHLADERDDSDSDSYYDDSDSEDEETKKPTKVILEMNKNADTKLESLRLSNVTLKNIKNCTWTVNHLYLNGIPFTESSNMEIKEITLWSCQVNISVLPLSIEKLTITGINQRNCVCSHPIVLHNLKALTLDFNVHSHIIQFLHSRKFNCPFLVELHLKHLSGSLKEIELTWIPQTLKTLRLTKICIKDEGIDCNLSLSKLILCDYYPDELGNICGTHIQTTNLVLSFPSKCISNSKMMGGFVNFLNNQNICRGTDRRIYVGEDNWKWENETSNIEFHENPLRGYVDKKAHYYVFENQVGKAINSEEFKIAME